MEERILLLEGFEYCDSSDALPETTDGDVSLQIELMESTPAGILAFQQGDEFERSIELSWKNEKAVLVDSLDGDWLVPRLNGKTFLDNDTDDDQCVDWICNCCSVGLGTYKPIDHIPKTIAFELFQRRLFDGDRLESCNGEKIDWHTPDI